MSRSCIYIFCNPFFLVQIWCKTISNTINDTPRSPTKSDSFSHDIQRYLRFQTRSDKTNARAITPRDNLFLLRTFKTRKPFGFRAFSFYSRRWALWQKPSALVGTGRSRQNVTLRQIPHFLSRFGKTSPKSS